MGEGRRGTGMKWIHKALLLVLADIVTIVFVYYAALVLRFDLRPWRVPGGYLQGYMWAMPYWIAVTTVIFYGCRLYHSIWSLASVAELQRILAAYVLLIPAYAGGALFMDLHMPASWYLMGYIMSFCITTGIRFSYRLLRFQANRSEMEHSKSQDRVMVIGAGRAGQTLIKELINSNHTDVKVCCIIDDNPSILFSVCDQPGIETATMQRIFNTAALHPGSIICAGRSGKTGNPVLWDRRYFPGLAELTGDVGGRQIMDSHREQIRIVEAEAEELIDVDRREDLRSL